MALITHPEEILAGLADDEDAREETPADMALGLALVPSTSDRDPAPLRPIDRQWFRRFSGELRRSPEGDLDA